MATSYAPVADCSGRSPAWERSGVDPEQGGFSPARRGARRHRHESERQLPPPLCIVAGLAACAATAAAAAALLTPGRSAEADGPREVPRHALPESLQLLKPPQSVSVRCPASSDFGGAPRRPLYYTDSQAFRCLDEDNDDMVELDEMGPGHSATTSIQKEAFMQLLERGRERAIPVRSRAEAKVGRMARQVLQQRASSPEYPRSLQGGVPSAASDAAKDTTPGGEEQPGKVGSLFTFGAPAFSQDRIPKEGCFPGLRVYSQGTAAVDELGVLMRIADPAVWMLSELGFKHCESATLSLDIDNVLSSGYGGCSGGFEEGWQGPVADKYFWFDGHSPLLYQSSLDDIADAMDPAGSGGGAEVAASAEDELTSRGATMRVTSDGDSARKAIQAAGLEWSPRMQDTLGGKFRLHSVPKPGVVGLCTDDEDGTCRSVSFFPVGIVSAETSSGGARRLSAEAVQGAVTPGHPLDEIGAARRYAYLSVLSYQNLENMNVDSGMRGLDYVFVKRALGNMSQVFLFQHRESLECVLSFGMRDPAFLAQGPGQWTLNQDGLSEMAVDRQLFYWWKLLAGRTAKGPDDEEWQWSDVWREFERDTVQKQEDPASVVATTLFCGFKVQREIALATRDLLTGTDWTNMKQSLQKCSNVTAVGHGFGGAVATLWTACANSNREDGDCAASSWSGGEQAKLPPKFNAKGAGQMIRNKKSGKFLDLQGTLVNGKVVGQELVLSTRSSDGAEQKWTHEHGLLKNKLTNMCLCVHEGSFAQKSVVAMKPCPSDKETGGREHAWWDWFTSKNGSKGGLLVNQHARQCLSASLRMVRCPLTAQIWLLTAEGMIVNRVSGKCLNAKAPVNGRPATAAALSACQPQEASQQFHLTPDGRLKSNSTGLCLDMDDGLGTIRSTRLLLFECAPERSNNAQSFRTMSASSVDTEIPGVFIMSELSRKCLDIDSTGEPKDGDEVALRPCELSGVVETDAMWELTAAKQLVNRGANNWQRNSCLSAGSDGETASIEKCDTMVRLMWNMTKDGFIKTDFGSQECIAVDTTGTSVAVGDCDPKSGHQSWFLTPDGFFYNIVTDKCIDVASDGRHLEPAPCQLTDQKWRMTPEGFIESQLSGFCMDVRGNPPADMQTGASLVLYPCEKDLRVEESPVSTDQVWTYTGVPEQKAGYLKNVLSEKCVGVRNAWKDNGAPLVLTPCPFPAGGSASHPAPQKDSVGAFTPLMWNLTRSGFFKSILNGKCIDVRGDAAKTPSQPITLYDCEDSMDYTHQVWELVDRSCASHANECDSASTKDSPESGVSKSFAVVSNGSGKGQQQSSASSESRVGVASLSE